MLLWNVDPTATTTRYVRKLNLLSIKKNRTGWFEDSGLTGLVSTCTVVVLRLAVTRVVSTIGVRDAVKDQFITSKKRLTKARTFSKLTLNGYFEERWSQHENGSFGFVIGHVHRSAATARACVSVCGLLPRPSNFRFGGHRETCGASYPIVADHHTNKIEHSHTHTHTHPQ